MRRSIGIRRNAGTGRPRAGFSPPAISIGIATTRTLVSGSSRGCGRSGRSRAGAAAPGRSGVRRPRPAPMTGCRSMGPYPGPRPRPPYHSRSSSRRRIARGKPCLEMTPRPRRTPCGLPHPSRSTRGRPAGRRVSGRPGSATRGRRREPPPSWEHGFHLLHGASTSFLSLAPAWRIHARRGGTNRRGAAHGARGGPVEPRSTPLDVEERFGAEDRCGIEREGNAR